MSGWTSGYRDGIKAVSEEILRLTEANAKLRAVAEAARALHAVHDEVDDPEWSALGAALKALDGGDRG